VGDHSRIALAGPPKDPTKAILLGRSRQRTRHVRFPPRFVNKISPRAAGFSPFEEGAIELDRAVMLDRAENPHSTIEHCGAPRLRRLGRHEKARLAGIGRGRRVERQRQVKHRGRGLLRRGRAHRETDPNHRRANRYRREPSPHRSSLGRRKNTLVAREAIAI